MQSAFGVEHGEISKGATQMVLPGMAGAGKVAAKPFKVAGTRMGTPKMATNAATKNWGSARRAGQGILPSAGRALKAGFRAAPGTSIAAGSGLLAAGGVGTGFALNRNG